MKNLVKIWLFVEIYVSISVYIDNLLYISEINIQKQLYVLSLIGNIDYIFKIEHEFD